MGVVVTNTFPIDGLGGVVTPGRFLSVLESVRGVPRVPVEVPAEGSDTRARDSPARARADESSEAFGDESGRGSVSSCLHVLLW